MENKADYLFEVSWEVCNKVGGIYTVVTSKILQTQRYYKDNYITVGPYFNKKIVSGEFQEEAVPEAFQEIFATLWNQGVKCHYGTWLVEGNPKTILVDYSGFTYQTPDIKKELWDKYQIDSLNSQFHDFDEPIVWSTAVGKVLEQVANQLNDKKIVAHFHEWMAGGALLYLKARNVRIGKVFTTHATMLGRTLVGNGYELYKDLEHTDGREHAYRLGIQAKFLTEQQCAMNADVFTTVSETTGLEAEHLLKKKPDVLTLNGLDIEKFPTFEDASFKHKLFKGKIKEFLMYYFFPYYTFDLDNTLIYFMAGRYEYRGKGIDVFIKSLAKLNNLMMINKSQINIVVFIWIPGQGKAIHPGLLESKSFYEDIRDSIYDREDDIREKIIYGILSQHELDEAFLFKPNLMNEIKKKYLKFQKEGQPFMSTHSVFSDNEIILKTLRDSGLNNRPEDKVKVVYYPIYLTGADQLLDISYYEAIMGSHLGVFPSYYEPWGYTPLETSALGVASMTTDLTGFGRYVLHEKRDEKIPGIFVIHRENRTDDQVIEEMAQKMYMFSEYTKQDRIECKIRSKRLASHADWKILVENYIKAHNMAVDKAL